MYVTFGGIFSLKLVPKKFWISQVYQVSVLRYELVKWFVLKLRFSNLQKDFERTEKKNFNCNLQTSGELKEWCLKASSEFHCEYFRAILFSVGFSFFFLHLVICIHKIPPKKKLRVRQAFQVSIFVIGQSILPCVEMTVLKFAKRQDSNRDLAYLRKGL